MGPENCDPTAPINWQPNPDVYGIGVLLGFVATAYITSICCIIKNILDHISSKSGKANRFERWSFALGSAITSFSDQQVITGISLILGGWTQIPLGLSVYHWETVANLAWFSAATHLVTLTSLRTSKSWGLFNSPVRIMRVTLMGILIVMIIVAMWPISFIWDDESIHIPLSLDGKPTAVPIWCLYHPKISWTVLWHPGQPVVGVVPQSEITNIISKNHGPYAHFNTGWFLVTISFLVVGYITRIQLLFFEGFTIWHTLLRAPKDQPSKLVEAILFKLRDYRPVQRKQLILRGMVVLVYKFAYALYEFAIIWKDVHSSILWEYTWLLLSLAWGTFRLFQYRFYSPEENVWGFGQVVAVGMLLLPVTTFFDAFNALPSDISTTTTLPASNHLKLPLTSHSRPCPAIAQTIHSHTWYLRAFTLLYTFSLAIGIFILYRLVEPDSHYTWVYRTISRELTGSIFTFIAYEILFVYLFILLFAPGTQWVVEKIAVHFQSHVKSMMTHLLWGILMFTTLCTGLYLALPAAIKFLIPFLRPPVPSYADQG
ncbi:hypothetical protein EAF04_009079 [Stromatinia cepivora]|nr:hypothetical protein EAF04_009079 [Stromatinia cepivora]